MPDIPSIGVDARFIEALTRHQPVLEAFCHANLASRNDAQEVLQNTNVKLWEKASSWNSDTEFLPWAFAVARFTLLSFVRDRSRDRLIFDEEAIAAMAAETEAVASELPDRREALRHCLMKLTREQRGLVDAHYVAGRTLRELATSSSRTESAMKMSLLRIRQQLSECIQRRLRPAAT